MNEYKIIFENGDYLYTRMNATLDEAKAYYLGKLFNLGSVGDDMQKCVSLQVA